MLSSENAWTKVEVLPALPQTRAEMEHKQCCSLLLGLAEQQPQWAFLLAKSRWLEWPPAHRSPSLGWAVLLMTVPTPLTTGWEHHNLYSWQRHQRPWKARSNADIWQDCGWWSTVITFYFCYARCYLHYPLAPHYPSASYSCRFMLKTLFNSYYVILFLKCWLANSTSSALYAFSHQPVLPSIELQLALLLWTSSSLSSW